MFREPCFVSFLGAGLGSKLCSEGIERACVLCCVSSVGGVVGDWMW